MVNTKYILTALVLIVGAGAVSAANPIANWSGDKSDMIRCEDAVTNGTPACGSSVTGTDTLKKGGVTVTDKNVIVTLTGAAASKDYALLFIPLTNTGANVFGPYSSSFVNLGTFTTKTNGAGSAKFSAATMNGPSLGYFMVTDASLAVAQFVTGFDPIP